MPSMQHDTELLSGATLAMIRANVLRDYRATRRYRDPFYAAETIRDAAARYAADRLLEDGLTVEWDAQYTREQYRVARDIYNEVVARGAIRSGSQRQRTRSEDFWSGHGKRAAVSS